MYVWVSSVRCTDGRTGVAAFVSNEWEHMDAESGRMCDRAGVDRAVVVVVRGN